MAVFFVDDSPMKNIFVPGGTGFVGAHVCEKLVREGWQVTVPTRRLANAQALLHLPNLTLLELDVHDAAALGQAVAGHSALVNLVAILHGTQAAFERVHVALPRSIGQACALAGVEQVVHLSALGADAQTPANAPSMYLRSKGAGEAALLQAAGAAGAGQAARPGFDLSILRPSVIFGAEDKFINLFASLQKLFPVLPLAGASARFQPVWVQDVASAVVRCLAGVPSLPSPRTIEVAGPEVFTLKQLVQLAARLSGVAGGLGRHADGAGTGRADDESGQPGFNESPQRGEWQTARSGGAGHHAVSAGTDCPGLPDPQQRQRGRDGAAPARRQKPSLDPGTGSAVRAAWFPT